MPMLAETKALYAFIVKVVTFLVCWLVLDIIPGGFFSISSFILISIMIFTQRQVAAGPQCPVSSKLSGKVAVVTGSSAGIGEEAAIELAKMDATVIFACRSEAKARTSMAKARNANSSAKLHFVKLDLGDFDSVKSAAQQIKELLSTFQSSSSSSAASLKLDYLINNGGLMVMGNKEQKTKSGFEVHIGTNVLGHMMLTELLLPNISAAKGRIVNVSSITAAWIVWPDKVKRQENKGKPMRDLLERVNKMDEVGVTPGSLNWGYFFSKGMNIVYTRYLAKRFKGTGVRVTSLHPGVVATDIVTIPVIGTLFRKLGKFVACKTTNEGAQTTLFCALQGTGLQSGSFYADCTLCDDLIPTDIYYDNEADIEACMEWCLDAMKLDAPVSSPAVAK